MQFVGEVEGLLAVPLYLLQEQRLLEGQVGKILLLTVAQQLVPVELLQPALLEPRHVRSVLVVGRLAGGVAVAAGGSVVVPRRPEQDTVRLLKPQTIITLDSNKANIHNTRKSTYPVLVIVSKCRLVCVKVANGEHLPVF